MGGADLRLHGSGTFFYARRMPAPMAERHRAPEEPEGCSVSGCKEQGERSVASKKYQGAMPGVALNGEVGRRVHLCRRHYREYRKATKEDRELDRLSW